MLDKYTIFKNFIGIWDFNRIITGSLTAVKAYGTAEFKPTSTKENELHYIEQGIIVTANYSGKITREYFYLWEDMQIKVLFSVQGKPANLFHVINDQFIGNHVCINDQYQAKYNFLQNDKFILTYKVHGPKKNYVSITRFIKR